MRLFILTLAIASLAAGCGGGSEEASEPLQAGVYEYELTEQYLLDNGISQFQAESELGAHKATLGAGWIVRRLVEDGRKQDRLVPRDVRRRRRQPRRVQVVHRVLRRLGDDLLGRR